LADAIIRPITSAASVARKPAPRRISSFEPVSSAAIDGCLRGHMPPAAPKRMAMKEAIKATVELMDSLCAARAGDRAI
jgi:hypothetical protein